MTWHRTMRRCLFVLSLLVGGVSLLAGCDESPDTGDQEESFVVPPGKADNFFSLSAQEYYVRGEYYVELSASEAAGTTEQVQARVRELVLYRQIAVNWFLLQYLMGPENEHENKFESLTKNGSYEDLDIRQDPANPLRYTFRFQQEVGGQLDLIEALPTTTLDDGTHVFPLPIGKPTNTEIARLEINNEWYRKAPWDGFDPAKAGADKIEYLQLSIVAEPRSSDAWIDYARLFEDGELTIGIHWGWDYHKAYHLVHSADVYGWLLQQGFKSPADSYETYSRTSGPLTKTIKADGREVVVKIWLYWGKPGTDSDPDTASGGRILEADMRASFAERDVVIFSGHSGPFYGYALANWRTTEEGDLDDSEIASMKMPGTYQLVLSEGCDTYAMGEAFWHNPAKAGQDNLDVVTTTNFSNASTAGVVRNFLLATFDTANGVHKPWKFGDLLRKLDGNSSWFHSMYGVHGIDDNPRLHPYGDVAGLCNSCSRDADCGGPGNTCVRLVSGERVCSVECSAADACPTGYACDKVATGSWITSLQCVPAQGVCPVQSVETGSVRLIINELLADPPTGIAGDANQDGTRDSTGDEFVELVNIGTEALDISGYTLADSAATRFAFPANTKVEPGQAVVVFGGGDADALALLAESTGARVFGAAGLGLNNLGDTVTIFDNDDQTVDSVRYGEEAGADRSLVRERDGDPEAPFIAHPGVLDYSAGTRLEGAAF